MSNMSYCRHENTASDLADVVELWDDYEEGSSAYEDAARKRIVELVAELHERFVDEGLLPWSQENHRTRWTEDEDASLQSEWDGTRATRAVIAEILGRTPDSVSQRHYTLTWGSAAPPAAEKPEEGTPRREPVRVTRRVETVTFEVDPDQVCPRCWTVRSSSGACLC